MRRIQLVNDEFLVDSSKLFAHVADLPGDLPLTALKRGEVDRARPGTATASEDCGCTERVLAELFLNIDESLEFLSIFLLAAAEFRQQGLGADHAERVARRLAHAGARDVVLILRPGLQHELLPLKHTERRNCELHGGGHLCAARAHVLDGDRAFARLFGLDFVHEFRSLQSIPILERQLQPKLRQRRDQIADAHNREARRRRCIGDHAYEKLPWPSIHEAVHIRQLERISGIAIGREPGCVGFLECRQFLLFCQIAQESSPPERLVGAKANLDLAAVQEFDQRPPRL